MLVEVVVVVASGVALGVPVVGAKVDVASEVTSAGA